MTVIQKIEEIELKELKLWTENPRDPVNSSSSNQEIINKALFENDIDWELKKLSKSMGPYFDYSELPTVVYNKNVPIVFDGNRRIALGILKHGLIELSQDIDFDIPEYPNKIPCVVCDEKTAIKNVYRKHGKSGTWKTLHKDAFVHYKMGAPKSDFLILDEETNIITRYSMLNKRFVKDEIITSENLKKIGFYIENGKLLSNHENNESFIILRDIITKIEKKEITTRKNRGKLLNVLDKKSLDIVKKNKNNKKHKCRVRFGSDSPNPIKTPRSKRVTQKIFGNDLHLKSGTVNNIYHDIIDLYNFFNKNRDTLSDGFSSIIRMSLRLLCEKAAKESGKSIGEYLKENFTKAKKNLSQDQKTTLSSQVVIKSKIISLIQFGAHDYEASRNLNQTIAISIILGEILKISHGKSQ